MGFSAFSLPELQRNSAVTAECLHGTGITIYLTTAFALQAAF